MSRARRHRIKGCDACLPQLTVIAPPLQIGSLTLMLLLLFGGFLLNKEKVRVCRGGGS